jgi:hypothetical protein
MRSKVILQPLMWKSKEWLTLFRICLKLARPWLCLKAHLLVRYPSISYKIYSQTCLQTLRYFIVQARAPLMRNNSKFSVFSNMRNWKPNLPRSRKNLHLGKNKISQKFQRTVLDQARRENPEMCSYHQIEIILSYLWIVFCTQNSIKTRFKTRHTLTSVRIWFNNKLQILTA